MSIATKRGDRGQTNLASGTRVSKASVRVECSGNIDELTSALGMARALCTDSYLKERTKAIQRELFRIGSGLCSPAEIHQDKEPAFTALVDALTAQVHELEATEGLLADWSLSGEDAASAAFDLARTVCRRAERSAVKLSESGERVEATALAYLNRLSDLLWLYARVVELRVGASSSLREANEKPGPRWSRAW